MTDEPSTNGPQTGRDAATGRFLKGNPGGPGNPGAAWVAENRRQFRAAIKTGDIKKTVAVLRKVMSDAKAKSTDRITAAREILDRCIGKVVEAEILDRIADLEAKAGTNEH